MKANMKQTGTEATYRTTEPASAQPSQADEVALLQALERGIGGAFTEAEGETVLRAAEIAAAQWSFFKLAIDGYLNIQIDPKSGELRFKHSTKVPDWFDPNDKKPDTRDDGNPRD